MYEEFLVLISAAVLVGGVVIPIYLALRAFTNGYHEYADDYFDDDCWRDND